MKRASALVGLLAVCASTALAEPAPSASLAPLKDRYGFNWYGNPARAKCVRISDALLKDFEKNYVCDLTERTNSASGKPRVTCLRKDETKEYTIFKTKALCEEERETQAANAG
ncbi:MAG: hypothetical protein ABW123_18315 [Cystobacter sp.]